MDYQDQAVEENRRNPKNRFLGLFCHASDVDDHWGPNLSFKCGVILFSVIMGIWTIYDIPSISLRMGRMSGSLFPYFCILRFFSDLLVIIAIIYAICSIFQNNYRRATIAYYVLTVSLIIDTVFNIYIITCFFSSYYWSNLGFRLIIWLLNEFVLFIFVWILFCNMVDINRKNKQSMVSNPF